MPRWEVLKYGKFHDQSISVGISTHRSMQLSSIMMSRLIPTRSVIKKNKDYILDRVYKLRDEGELDAFIDTYEEFKKDLNQDKLIWWW